MNTYTPKYFIEKFWFFIYLFVFKPDITYFVI